MRWLLLWVRLPTEPSRHRVAVWRELRRTGAVSLGQGSWAVPDVTAFTEGIDRAVAMAERGDGEVIVLSAAGRSERDEQRLAELFTAERDQEWAEFIADCAKFDTEIDREIRQRKFTLAELEERRAEPGPAAALAPHDQDPRPLWRILCRGGPPTAQTLSRPARNALNNPARRSACLR